MSKFNWKKALGKKWTFPAIYMVAAALILALMWWYQDPNEYFLSKDELGLEEIAPEEVNTPVNGEELATDNLGDAITVTKPVEKVIWPVENSEDIQVTMEFFDENAKDEVMENSIVSFEDELWPHSGIDIVSTTGKEFNVLAALSGEVVRTVKDPVVGHLVELKHENGLVTIYSSLADVQVKEGDIITQGAVLGKSSRNSFEKDQGVHLHFEVRKDGFALNPDIFFEQEVEKVLEQLTEQTTQTTE